MQSGHFSYHSSTIHYLRWGTASKLLLCFHGYGESSAHFKFLAEGLQLQHTIIAIDLPYHGETLWNADTLKGNDMVSIIEGILNQEQIDSKEWTLIGFSMGGRIALSVYELTADRINKLVLLAPDGLKLNFWYWLSTQTAIGNSAFRLTMRSPGWFLGMLRLGNKVRVLNRSIYKFVEYYIHDENVRQELYDRWTSMRSCKPDLARIKKDIRENQTKVRLLYGKHDRIILQSPAKKFIAGLDDVQLKILECGHQVLHAKNVNEIVDAIIN